MTDKVQKIREKVVEIVNSINPFIPDEDGKNSDYEAGKLDAATQVLQIIDSFEEPVSNPIDFEQELYKAFGQVKDFTLGMRIAEWFYDMGKNSQEPVSEELEEASKEWLIPQLDKSYANYGEVKMMELTHFDGYAMLDAIEFGAKWQKKKDFQVLLMSDNRVFEKCYEQGKVDMKEQMEANRIEHCNSITEEQYNLEAGFIDQHLDKYNRMPTFLDAIEYGMDKIANLMAEKATDAVVHTDAGGYPYIPEIELYDYDKDIPLAKEGDKYKVVLIKEE